MSVNQKLKNQLNKSKTGSSKVSFKRLFLTSGKEYVLRPVSTELQDPDSPLFKIINLHGGFKHPNYDNEYASNFVCGGKGCPLCIHARELAKAEKNLSKEQKTSWKKLRKSYAMYFMINQENKELTLVFVPNDVFQKAEQQPDGSTKWVPTSESLQEILYKKLESAADQNINPFDLKEGCNIHISSTVIEKVTKWSVSISTEKNPVTDNGLIKKLENVDLLNAIYKRLPNSDLQHIADGTRIPSNKEKEVNKNQQKDQSLNQNVHSASEQDYDETVFKDDQDLEAQLLGDDSFELDEASEISTDLFAGMFSKENKEE